MFSEGSYYNVSKHHKRTEGTALETQIRFDDLDDIDKL